MVVDTFLLIVFITNKKALIVGSTHPQDDLPYNLFQGQSKTLKEIISLLLILVNIKEPKYE